MPGMMRDFFLHHRQCFLLESCDLLLAALGFLVAKPSQYLYCRCLVSEFKWDSGLSTLGFAVTRLII
jgi:hypothetical protein